MASSSTNKSPQDDENEGNSGVHNASAFSTDMVFKYRQDLFDWVQKVGRSLGYVIVIKRSKTTSSGVMSKVFLMCDRGGTYKSKSSTRNRGTKKINCPFELVGKYLKMHDAWTLRVICEKHNHEPSQQMEDHPCASRLSANETRLVFDLSRKNVKPQAILSTLKKQNKSNADTIRTIYNACQKFQGTQRAGTFMRQVVNSDESASPSPVDPVYTFEAHKLKRAIDHTDPLAVTNWVQEPDSAKYGSITKDVKDLCLPRTQISIPSFTRFPAPEADSMERNHVKDVCNANPVRDDVVMCYDGNDHDTNTPGTKDEPTSARPFQPYQDLVLNKPEGRFIMKQFLDVDMDLSVNQHSKDDEENCDHSFILKEDTGYVCCVCGAVERAIEFIIDSTSPFSTNMVFKSRQDLFDWVQKVGRSLGYAIVTRRSKSNLRGTVSKVFLMCDRGGIYKSTSSIRNSGTRKTNCPFQLVGKHLKMYDVWTLRVICENHNHEPTPNEEDHPCARGLSTNETGLMFDLSSKHAKPQAIISTLKEQNKTNGDEEECDHSFILEEDGGYVCHACGVIERAIDNTSPFSTNLVFKSRQDLIDWVQKVGRSLGYVIVIKSSKTTPSGAISKVFLMCDRGGIYKRKCSTRNSGTKKINCPFGLVGKYWKKYDVWTLRVKCEKHNHEPTPHTEGHPYAMRLSGNETRLVFDFSKKNVRPQAILSTLKEQIKDNISKIETVYNARQKLRRIQHADPVRDIVMCDAGNVHDTKASDADDESTSADVTVQSNSDTENNSQFDINFDGLADIWNEMTVGLESSKNADMDLSVNQHVKEDEEECDHSYILKEDIGYVCRVCGVIERGIESLIEYQRPKRKMSRKAYYYEGRSDKPRDTAGIVLVGVKLPGTDFTAGELSVHPWHRKQMKPHQIEGFNFLLSNLVCDNPGGCILAHAPGSGKTFMLISFIQSFMAKYPDARPLVVLPRGILATWKKEFKRWQVENLPLLDFYSHKADNRVQQLEVLKQWANMRSILFLGYKQFSTIVCDSDRSSVAATCQEIVLTYPSLVILDEGHTPRNKDTDVFISVEKVQTPRKVILSGTLYQNHVREVFNILNLVRPRFLSMEDSRTIKRRILSRVLIETRRNLFKKSTDNEFCELVEHTLLKDENFKRKVTVIEDLREMTKNVLHYYKGDFLDELPGHVDFSIFLNLSPRQKHEVFELKSLARKFKVSSDGSAIYVHPDLKSLVSITTQEKDDDIIKIDEILEKLDFREGVKAKFFLNLLRLCTFTGEKLLVFGQYLLPLKFLLRLTMKVKGWRLNKEIFMITGDHDNEEREVAMDQFNNSSDAKVFFGSIKACGEGVSLVGASRIIILDVHLNPSVTRQAISRAFRPGQVRKVYTYRLIAAGSPEEEDHTTCFRKESIAKMWFTYNECCHQNEFEMVKTDAKDCGDQFLETPWLSKDVTAIYKRS